VPRWVVSCWVGLGCRRHSNRWLIPRPLNRNQKARSQQGHTQQQSRACNNPSPSPLTGRGRPSRTDGHSASRRALGRWTSRCCSQTCCSSGCRVQMRSRHLCRQLDCVSFAAAAALLRRVSRCYLPLRLDVLPGRCVYLYHSVGPTSDHRNRKTSCQRWQGPLRSCSWWIARLTQQESDE